MKLVMLTIDQQKEYLRLEFERGKQVHIRDSAATEIGLIDTRIREFLEGVAGTDPRRFSRLTVDVDVTAVILE